MEFRKVFDTVVEQFDKYRPRYSEALFSDLIAYAKIKYGKDVLEIGPGTGQATEPILNTKCFYCGIELGENLTEVMRSKYGNYENFNIINADFITHDFQNQKFDIIYSATAIHWITEHIAFKKTFDLLKPGGVLAMFLTKSDYKTPNKKLYDAIQHVYSVYFKLDVGYKFGIFAYENAVNYGYVDFEKREYFGRQELTAEEYVAFCGTHSDHIALFEPYKSKFYDGIKNAVDENGGKIVFLDKYVMYLAKKPFVKPKREK